jgi:nucleoside-diphosphate-sugar epimerase
MTRVAIVGASGNVGSRVVEQLRAVGIDDLVGVVRRPPDGPSALRWVSCDIGARGSAELLAAAFDGVDAVVHLAWQIQPGRDVDQLHRTNVIGSQRIADAVVAARVPALIYASSVGTYSPGPKHRPVEESWPTDGIPTSTYARHKAAVERQLDTLEASHPAVRVVRLRPGLIFQRAAASEIARYFLGPYVPLSAIRRRLVPVVPAFPRLSFQVVHTEDVARAFARAVTDESARGAFNLAADPVFDADRLGETLGARPVPVPFRVLRSAADAAFRARLIPTDAGWLDLAAAVPVMSTERARTVLGWEPRHSAQQTLLELIEGMHDKAGRHTAPLEPAPSGARRVAESVLTAVRGGPGSENP